MSSSNLLSLPVERILEIAVNMPLDSVNNLCQVNAELNSIICEDDYYWQLRTERYYPNYFDQKDPKDSWREFYYKLSLSSVYSLGIYARFTDIVYGRLSADDIARASIHLTQLAPEGIRSVSVQGQNYFLNGFDNKVIVFGDNEHGQLGLGNNIKTDTPTTVLDKNGKDMQAQQVSSGLTHTLLLDLNGYVWASGNNEKGQLGIGATGFLLDSSTDAQSHDLQIPASTNVFENVTISDISGFKYPIKAIQISSRYFHNLIIDIDYNVWAFGDNEYGQLGLGDQLNRDQPFQLVISGTYAPFKAKQISTGGAHSAVIDMYDNVWVFGGNTYGQLGLGDRQNRLRPTLLFVPGTDTPFKAKQISTGAVHTLIIDMDDIVWGCGLDNGQLGVVSYMGVFKILSDIIRTGNEAVDVLIPTQIYNINDKLLKAKQISTGANESAIIDFENKIWVSGINKWDNLGIDLSNTPQLVKLVNSGLGTPTIPRMTQLANLTARSISLGHSSTLILGKLEQAE